MSPDSLALSIFTGVAQPPLSAGAAFDDNRITHVPFDFAQGDCATINAVILNESRYFGRSEESRYFIIGIPNFSLFYESVAVRASPDSHDIKSPAKFFTDNLHLRLNSCNKMTQTGYLFG